MASNYGGDRAYCGKANAGLGAPAGHQCRPSWHSTCWDLVVCWYRAHGNIVQKRQRGLFVVALGFAGVPKLADLNGDGGSGGMAQRAVGRSLMPHLFAALAVDRKGRRRGRRGGEFCGSDGGHFGLAGLEFAGGCEEVPGTGSGGLEDTSVGVSTKRASQGDALLPRTKVSMSEFVLDGRLFFNSILELQTPGRFRDVSNHRFDAHICAGAMDPFFHDGFPLPRGGTTKMENAARVLCLSQGARGAREALRRPCEVPPLPSTTPPHQPPRHPTARACR